MMNINEELERIGVFEPRPDDDMLVCRCEEITRGEIRRAVHEGIFTIEEMRRWLRNGMGLCQGQTCGQIVRGIIAAERKISPELVAPATSRAPMRPTAMDVLAKDGGEQA